VVIASAPAAPAGARPGPRRRPGEFGGGGGGGGRKFTPRRKVCAFCVDKIKVVDYKDLGRLRRFLSERGKIEPRRKTGTCAAHQRSLNVALKRARQLAMLPFTAEHIRITGVLVREPGASPFRGPRGPRPIEAPEAAATDASTPDAEAAAPNGVAAADGVAAESDAPAAESEPAPVVEADVPEPEAAPATSEA
jgi:small subunit ribosomal protein S18